MTNQERLDKLKQAETLIRQVEFSYPIGDPIRQRLYKIVVDTFSYMGSLDQIIAGLKIDIYSERHGKNDKIE